MRNRSSYHYYYQTDPNMEQMAAQTPQTQYRGSVGGLVNQILLLLFALCLVLWIFGFFFNPVRWVFLIVTVVALALMWYKQAFLPRGRLVLTGAFGAFLLVTVLSIMISGSGQQPAITTYSTGGDPALSGFAAADPVITADPFAIPSLTNQGLTDPSGLGAGDPNDQLAMLSGTEIGGEGNQGTSNAMQSEAEKALNLFMECWKTGIVDNMVPLTSPSWRAKMSTTKNGPSQNLYWKFSPKKLDSWYFEGVPSGTDQDESRTITVIATVTTQGNARTYRYDAIVVQSEGQWYVDPDSLAGGTRVEDATPQPQEGGDLPLVITPSPTPKATEEPTKNTKLYYNKKGGKFYHIQAECTSVDKSYLPLDSFNYGDLDKKPYNKLEPCPKCNAPGRK